MNQSINIFRTRHLYALESEIPSEKHYLPFELLGLTALFLYSLSSNEISPKWTLFSCVNYLGVAFISNIVH